MGRYKTPQKPGSKYITPEGAQRLRAELTHLWKVKRPEVTSALSDAAAEGDRSENAEYIYRKKQLGEIDRRVRYLSKRLDGLTVVEHPPGDHTRIFFGAWFRLADPEGCEFIYRLVGPDEFDFQRAYISMDSPMGRAVLKRSAGEEFTVTLPDGDKHYSVVEVSYEPIEENPEE